MIDDEDIQSKTEDVEEDRDGWDDEEFYDRHCTADGVALNDIGIEFGLEGCALTDDEKEAFCRH